MISVQVLTHAYRDHRIYITFVSFMFNRNDGLTKSITELLLFPHRVKCRVL